MTFRLLLCPGDGHALLGHAHPHVETASGYFMSHQTPELFLETHVQGVTLTYTIFAREARPAMRGYPELGLGKTSDFSEREPLSQNYSIAQHGSPPPTRGSGRHPTS